MSKITQSQIYLFLSEQNNWQITADTNNDGALTAYEFRTFLNESIDGWNGLSSSDLTYDVVNKFWENIDQNNKTKGVTRDILDEQEMARAEVQIEAYKELKNFVDSKVSTDMPSDIKNSKYADLWKNEIISALDNSILNIIQGLPKDTKELTNEIKTQITNQLNESYNNQVKNNATIQCYIEITYDSLGSEYKSILDSLDNYSLRADKDLQNIINNWIKENGTNSTNLKGDIENLIKGYLATAQIGDGNSNAVKGLGKDGTTTLNEIQKASIKKAVLEQFKSKINSFSIYDRNGNKIDLNNNEYIAICEKYIEQFTSSDGWYKGIKAENNKSLFETIQAKAIEKFQETSYFTMFQYEIQMIDSYLNFEAIEGNAFYDKLVAAGLNPTQIQELVERNGNNYNQFLAKFNEIVENITSNKSDYLNSNGNIDFDKVDSALVPELKKIFNIPDVEETKATTETENSKPMTIQEILGSASFEGITDPSGGHLEVYGANGKIADNTQVSSCKSLLDLYNSNAVIQLHSGESGMKDESAKATAKTRLGNLTTMILDALLKTNKFDETKLRNAVDTVRVRYCNNIQGRDSHIKKTKAKDRMNGSRDIAILDAQNGESGIYGAYSWHGKMFHGSTAGVWVVSFKKLVDDILKEYGI